MNRLHDLRRMSSPSEDHDWYAILGVSKTASTSEIKSTFKKLAIKHHPDKNLGDEEAGSRFALICKAHIILTDPDKRQIYDRRGNTPDLGDDFVVDVGDLGVISKLSFSFFNKCGIRVETQISPEVLSQAKRFAQKEDNNIPHEIKFDASRKCSEESQKGSFYTFSVSQEDLDRGVILHYRSNHNDKFKIILFDAQGDVVLIEESEFVEGGKSEARFLFLPFPNYRLNPPQNNLEKITPLSLLHGYQKNISSIMPGEHLFCVYQNNWYKSGTIKILMTKFNSEYPNLSAEITSVEGELADKKGELDELKAKYLEAEKVMELLKVKVEEETHLTKLLLEKRGKLHNKMIVFPTENKEIPHDYKKKGFLGGLLPF